LELTEESYEIELLNKLLGNKLDNIHEQIIDRGIELGNEINKWISLDDISTKIENLENENPDLMHKLKIFEDKAIANKLNIQVSYDEDRIQVEKIELDLKNIFDLISHDVNKEIIREVEEIKEYEKKAKGTVLFAYFLLFILCTKFRFISNNLAISL